MRIRVTPPNVPPPTLVDARLLGDPVEAGSVLVLVGPGVAFSFERQPPEPDEDEVWSGGEALTAGRGAALSEAWLSRAREVAAEALRRALSGAEAEDTLRCEECSRVLCSPELRGAGAVKRAYCGPDHVLVFDSGRTLTVPSDGPAYWWKTSPPPAAP